MTNHPDRSDGATRVAYILGVPLAEDVERQWPQMGEVVRSAQLVAEVEGNFPELTLKGGPPASPRGGDRGRVDVRLRGRPSLPQG